MNGTNQQRYDSLSQYVPLTAVSEAHKKKTRKHRHIIEIKESKENNINEKKWQKTAHNVYVHTLCEKHLQVEKPSKVTA